MRNPSHHMSTATADARRADPLGRPLAAPPILTRWDHPVRLSARDASRDLGLRCGSRW